MNRSSHQGKKDPKVPTEFAGDPIIWATWLYFAEQKTQNEVARELGVSRATIANYLSESRRRNLVAVSIAPDLLGNIELGRELAAKFGLTSAHVVPTPEGKLNLGQLLRDRLGIAAAHVFGASLTPNAIVGVSSGRTVQAMGEALTSDKLNNVQVVQVAGSSVRGETFSPEYCTALIASRLGAQCINLYAPAVISSTRLCREILQEPSLVHQFSLINSLDTLVFGVSGLDRKTKFSDSDFVTEDVVQEYLDLGASGVVLGRFIDPKGRETNGPLSGRIIAMDLAAIKKVPTRIMVAGGRNKQGVIQAMLKGGFVSHLVTDMKTAEKLV